MANPDAVASSTLNSEKLRKLRESRGLSQSELSKRSGIARETLSRLENGERELSARHISALSAAYGIAPDYFFSDAPSTANPAGSEEPTDKTLLQILARHEEHAGLMHENMAKLVENALRMTDTMERTRADHARLTDALTQALATQQAFAAKQSDRLTSRIEELEQQVDYLQRQLGGATPPQKRRQQLS